MIDKRGRGHVATGAAERRIVWKRFAEQHFTATFGGAGLRHQPPSRADTRVRQKIDVLDIDDDCVDQGRGGLGAGEFVDDDSADEITQRRGPPIMA